MKSNTLNFRRTAWAGGIAGVVGAALVLFFFDPTRFPIYPECAFHRLTGLDCPGCGGLRAAHALLHGQLDAALHFNLFFVLSLPLLAWIGFRFLRHQIAGGPPVRIRLIWLWLYLAAYLAFGILRNLPVPLLAAFAP